MHDGNYFEGHEMKNRRDQSSDADQKRGNTVEDGISDSRAVRFVGQMAKIQGCGKRAAECRGSQCCQPINQQRWPSRVVVPGNFDALQNLQGHDGIQRAHGQNDGKVSPTLAVAQEFENIDRLREMNAQSDQRWRRRQMIKVQGPQNYNQNHAGEYAQQTARNPERQSDS